MRRHLDVWTKKRVGKKTEADSFRSIAALLFSGSILLAGAITPAAADYKVIENANRSAKKRVKISFDVRSLHDDGQRTLVNGGEIVWSFKKSDEIEQSGINSGHRDQYVAGLNHLYANAANQRLGNVFYTQGVEMFKSTRFGLMPTDSGERTRMNSFTGMELQKDPLLVATVDGIAFLEETLTGKPNLVVGSHIASLMPFQNRSVFLAATGKELDQAWDKNGCTPMIVAVNANTRMFTGLSVNELRKEFQSDSVPFGGHVVVISERREGKNGSGKTSRYEYKLLNSWGDDENGLPRNGWVGADQLASAMNYMDETDVLDESFIPTRRGKKNDLLPVPGKNMFSRLDHGLVLTRDSSAITFEHSSLGRGILNDEPEVVTRGSGNPETEANELKKRIADSDEGFDSGDQKTILADINQILTDKNYKGDDRQFPLSDKEKAGVLHEANRLFQQSKRIYAQGLDQKDRNRGLIGLLHDTANPEHINQGAHNTCNVTTMMKIEAMLRPAAQAKRFVDMYTNKNGDGTVDMPM